MSQNTENHYRKRLYDIKSASTPSVEEKFRQILRTGREYLGVDNGHVKRIDQMQGTHEVLASVGNESVDIAVGDVHDHAATFCRQTIQSDTPLAIDHASEGGWADDPAYQAHGLECYLGTTISVRGEPFGTLCYVSRTPRQHEFTPSQRAFVDLAAGIIETELTDREYERELASKNHLIGVLNRVLRHNIRNDLNVVGGYADLLEDRLGGETRSMAGEIATVADSLAEQAEKAHLLETIANDSTSPRPRDIVPVVKEVVDELESTSPTDSIDVTAPDSVRAVATEYLDRALYELGENAIRHGGPSPTVQFRVDPDPGPANQVVIEVQDDGPGLSDHDRTVLAGTPETALEHGSGVGLWIVYWVVNQSGGAVRSTVENGTTVSIHLQQTVGPSEE